MMKKLAVVSSVLLVGGYVFLKGGGCSSTMPSTKSESVVSDTKPERDSTLMPGSKSSAPFTSNGNLDTESPKDREFMSSSKSLSPVIRSKDLESRDSTTRPTTGTTR